MIEIPGEQSAETHAQMNAFLTGRAGVDVVAFTTEFAGRKFGVLVYDREKYAAHAHPAVEEAPEVFPADVKRALVPVATGAQDTAQAKPRSGNDTAQKPAATTAYTPGGGPVIVDGVVATGLPSDGIGGA